MNRIIRASIVAISCAVSLLAQPIYHNGQVQVQGLKMYFIPYGPDWPETDKENVRRWIAGLGASGYLQGLMPYYQESAVGRTYITATSQLMGEFYNPGTYGAVPSSVSLPLIVKEAIDAMGWPCDPQAIYAVVAGRGTSTPLGGGGWHFQLPCNGVQIPALHAIAWNSLGLTVLSHETMETATDPLFDGWYTSSGYEIADICPSSTTILVMGQAYQVQNYYSLNGGCGSGGSVPPPPPPPPPNLSAPVVTILSPLNGSSFPCGSVLLIGSANDLEDGTISARIVWRIGNKQVGTGASVTLNFGCGGPNIGFKTVVATVTDSGGKSDSDSVDIVIRKK